MDNQPVTEPGANSPDQAPVQTTESIEPIGPIEPTEDTKNDVVLESGKKKRKKLIIALISIFAVLLVGGGIFTAFAIICNQPSNIAMSALSNLLNAKSVGVNGVINLDIEDENISEALGIDAINIKIDNQSAGISNATIATLNIDFTNSDDVSLELGETMISDGTFYLRANGLENFYNNVLYDTLKNNLLYQSQYDYPDCGSTGLVADCPPLNESTQDPTVSTAADNLLNQIGEIVATLDNQWLEFSIEDIVKDEMLGLSELQSQKIIDSYNCTIGIMNRMSDYSPELSNLYTENQFVVMTPGQDSFYDISFDATKLTSYANAFAQTKLPKDLAACYETDDLDINTENDIVTVDNISSMLEYLPQISARFDGFFSHHLAELKINQTDESFSYSSDLNFSYPSNLNVTAPTDARSIMEVVKEVYQKMQTTLSTYE